MNSLIALTSLVLIGYGFASGGILGAMTGFVAAVGIGSGLVIVSNHRDAELSIEKHTRISQRIGGVFSALLCAVGVYHGNWRWGWLWGLGGYTIGALLTVIIGVALAVKSGNHNKHSL
jgi:O-antigen/teichoic acid export membrane protein